MKSRSRLTRITGAGVALSLTLAGCGVETHTEPAADEATWPGAALIGALPTAQTTNGEAFDFGSLEGLDVMLWFWAPW